MVVNKLLVGRVDERHEEEERSGHDGKAPVWHHLGEVVGQESTDGSLDTRKRLAGRRGQARTGGGKTHHRRGEDVLGEEDTLGLNDEEVEKLVDVANQGIQRLARYGEVLAGTQLRRQSLAHDGLANNLGENRHAEGHPGQLERVADHIKVSSQENDGNDAGVGDGRSTCDAGRG